VVALVTLLLMIVASNVVARTPKVPEHLSLQQFPSRVGGWHGHNEFFDPDTIASLHVDDYLLRTYRERSERALWLYIAYYESQPTDVRVHSPAVCLPAGGWFIATSGTSRIETSSGPIFVNRNLIRKGDDSQVVVYWYQIHGHAIARELQAVGFLAWTALTQRRTDEALVRINAPITGSADKTTSEIAAFIRTVSPEFHQFLP